MNNKMEVSMNKKNTQQLSAPSMTVSLAALLAFAATTQAAVQTEGFYRLGEDDSGASNGGTVSTSLEHLNANGQMAAGGDLTPPGTAPTYTTDTPLSSSDFAIDTSKGFTNDGNLLTTANFLDVTGDDFGLEGWFKFPANRVNSGGLLDEVGEILSFGTTSNGFGIGSFGSLNNGEVRGFIGGSGTSAAATITGDTWTHLAFVMDGGQAKFYQDGTLIGSAITGTLTNGGTRELKIGDIDVLSDEVRVFTFSSGQFDASNDLLLDDASLQSQVIPEPQTYGLLLGAGVLLVSLARRRSHRA